MHLRTKAKETHKHVTALFMVLVMVFTMSGMNGGLSYVNAAAVETTTGKGNNDGAVIQMGELQWKDETKQEYTFPNANLTFTDDQLIFSLSVDNGGCFQIPDDYVGFTGVESNTGVKWKAGGNGGTYTSSVAAGDKLISMTFVGKNIKAEEIQKFLRGIMFYRNGVDQSKKQTISVVANKVKLRDGMCAVAVDGTLHYYEYIKVDEDAKLPSWYEAYAEAKTREFNGMHGYLATITTDAEQNYIYKYYAEKDPVDIQMQAWIGGMKTKLTSLPDGKWDAGEFREEWVDLGDPNNKTANPLATTWYWTCGPEAGKSFYVTDEEGHRCDTLGSTVADIQYNGWNTGEPNNKRTTDSNSGGKDHWTFQEYVTEYGYVAEGAWNDYGAYNQNHSLMKGYVVEYSPYTNDAAHGGNSESEKEKSSSVEVVVTADDKTVFELIEARLSKDTIKVGETLFVSLVRDEAGKNVDLLTDVTYQWQHQDADGTWKDYDGQTHQGYVPTTDDIGKHIRCKVIAKDGTDYIGTVYAGTSDGSNSTGNTEGVLVKTSEEVSVIVNPSTSSEVPDPVVTEVAKDANRFEGDYETYTIYNVLKEKLLIEVYTDTVALNPVFTPADLKDKSETKMLGNGKSVWDHEITYSGSDYVVSGLRDVGDYAVILIKYTDDTKGITYHQQYKVIRKGINESTNADVTINDTTPDNKEDSSVLTGPDKTTEGKYKYVITVPNHQETVEIDTTPIDPALFDTTYGTEGIDSTGLTTAKVDGSSSPDKIKITDLVVGSNGMVSVKVKSQDGSKTLVYEYEIIREKATTITPVDPNGTDTSKIKETSDSGNSDTVRDIYKVITVPETMDSLKLNVDLPDGAEVISVIDDGINKTYAVADDKSYTTSGIAAGEDKTVVYTVKTATETVNYHYTIKKGNTKNTSTDADVATSDSTPSGKTDGSTVSTPDASEANKKKFTITVPYDQDDVEITTTPKDGATFEGNIKNELTGGASIIEGSKPGSIKIKDLVPGSNGTVSVDVMAEDGVARTTYEYEIVKEAAPAGKFDVTPTNPDNTTNPSEGVTGPTKDTTASKGNDYVYKITLDSDVSKVTLTPDMSNVTIKDLAKNGTSVGSIPTNGVYTVDDIKPGADNKVTIKYTVKDKAGAESTYTYIIERKNGANADTKVEDPDPSTPGIPKIEEKDKVKEGTDTVQKITITVPADQNTLTIYPNPTKGATMDTTYGTNGATKVSGSGNITGNKLSQTTPELTVNNLKPGDTNNTVVRVKVKSADGKSSTIYEYTIVRQGDTSITPVDPDGKDTDKIEEKKDPDHPDNTTGTTKHYYKVIEIPYDMKDLELVPNLPDGATVTGIKEGDVSKTVPANNKYKVEDIVYGQDRTVEYTIQNGTTTEIYHYTIKKLAANNDTSIDTNVPDKTPTDPSDDVTVDNSTPSKTEVINGKTETVKDIIVKVPYKNTSVTLEPKVKEATSNIDTAYGDNGIKKDQLQGTANVTEDSAIDLTNKKSGTITIDNLECGKENIVSIRVVAEDGSSCIYRYKVTRENGKTNTITPSLPSDSTGTITGPTEDTTKTTDNDKYYTVVLPNGTDKVTMTPDINTGDKVTSITVDGTKVDTIPADGVYTVTEVTPDKAKDLVYEITDPSGNVTKYHYTISQEKKPEEPKKDTPVDKKDPTITDVTVKTEDNTTTPADVKIDNNNANKTIDISVPSNQTDYTFTPATKDPSSKITEVAKVSGPAEVSTSSDGKSFTAKGLDPKTPTIVKVTVTSSTGDTATYTVTIHRAEEGVTPDISVEMNGGSLDLNSLIPEDVRKNAKEILYHCCAHTVLAIDKNGTVRSIGRSNKYKSSLVHVIVKGQDNKWTDYTIYVKVNGATKKEEYGTLVDYKGLNYEITGADTCRVSSWKTNYNTKKKNIVIPDTIKANGKTYKVTAIAPGAFMRNSKIVTIKIGKNVQEIGNTSFVGLRKIKKFTISKKNKYLKVAGKSGNKAKMILSKNGKILYSMTNMQGSVTIPKSVKQITEYAGAGNVKMTKLVIPASVKRIDPCAFAHAKKMTYVQFKGKVPEMANNCVVDQMNYKKGKVYVPKKFYKQYKSAFQAASKKRYGIKQFPAMSRLKKK
mgnify:CR=1 FL=1